MLHSLRLRWRAAFARHPVLFPGLTLALWLLLTAFWRPLALPDEGRYASVALEMARSGDWAVPLLNGLPFFHKPPLFYWITAAGIDLFGARLLTARLAPLLAAWCMGMGSYLFLRCHSSHAAARWTLLVLATMPLYFGAAQYVNLDMLVAACISLTIMAAAHAVLLAGAGTPACQWRGWVWLAYALAALGVLAKGLIGAVLPAAVLLGWLGWQRHWAGVWRLLSLPGLLLFLLLALPWFVLMELRYAGFFHYFFIYQQFERFAETSFNNQHGVWFYPAVLLAATLPWSLWLITPLRQWWRTRATNAHSRPWSGLLHVVPMQGTAALHRLGWIWLLVILLFFSLPASKIVGYILPVLPAWAALVATRLRQWQKQHGALADWTRQHLSLLVGGLMGVLVIGAIALSPLESSYEAAPVLKAAMQPGDAIVMLEEYEYDLPFYLNTSNPVWVVSDWNSPDILRHDNWRKELYDAGKFDLHTSAAVFITPPEVVPRLCAALAQHGLWLWGDVDSGIFRNYPFLQDWPLFWQRQQGKERDGLWHLQGAPAMQALGCQRAGSAP